MNNFTLPATAWAITEPGLVKMLSGYKQAQSGLQISLEDFFTPRESMKVEQGVAIIHVKGALMDNAAPIHGKLEGTDYRQLRAEIAEAQTQNVEGFIFKMDTPGGSVAGLAEVAQMISEIEQPTVAYADGLCCSAGYYLAAGCDAIMSSPSATIGNIGTVLSWTDFSGVMEKMGISTETITNEGADLKGTFRENPMPEGQRQFLQDQSNQMGTEFQNFVTEHREVDAEVFRAGWYHGQAALTLGLADAIGTFEQAFSELRAAIESPELKPA